MPLFTIVAEYKDGTYVHQVDANNATTALKNWAFQPEFSEISGVGEKTKKEMIETLSHDYAEDLPVDISGTKNVWCTAIHLRGKLLLVHIIKTQT